MQCEIPNDRPICELSYEEILEQMGDRKYWIRFFVRPCCPPPSKEVAATNCERFRNEIRSYNVLTEEQKATLIAIVDENEAWYVSSPMVNRPKPGE